MPCIVPPGRRRRIDLRCGLPNRTCDDPSQATQLSCQGIGSLGDDSSRAEVSAEPYVSTQGGSGYAKDITFQNIVMDPIIVDQGYCDKAKPRRVSGGG
jgi:hypothetical protein